MPAQTFPGVSIIIPTFNRASLLKEALDSALSQTYPAFEVIVVDDGSTDETPVLLQAYEGKILCLRQPNRGVAAARNAGFCASTGAFVTFLDDDDRIYPQKISRQVQQLAASPEAGFVHCRHDYMDARGSLLARGGVLARGDVLVELLCGNFIWSGAPLIRRAVFEQAGGYNEQLSSAADYDLWLRICSAGHALACVQSRLGAYRLQHGSMVTGIERTEWEVLAALDAVFSRPDLPAQVRAARQQSYAAWRVWFSRRYYACGAYEDARRNLRIALQSDPGLSADLPRLRQSFLDEAADWRVSDGLAYIRGVIEHLPREAHSLAGERAALLARVCLGQAVKACARGETAAAGEAIRQALALDAALLSQPDELARTAAHYALILPADPLELADRFISLLREAAPGKPVPARKICAAVRQALGFDEYFSGHRKTAALHFLRAAWLSPRSFGNRGMRAALARSLPDLLRPGQEGSG